MKLTHERIETRSWLMVILVLLVVSVGGMVEIVPLFFQRSTTVAHEGLKPYNALELVGRDIYLREGCFGCHSQMIRPFRSETLRYGDYSKASESVYDHPFQWGSKRTGPDLARVGGRYSDDWHRVHLVNPRDVVPESNMPAYPWLEAAPLSVKETEARMRALAKVGVPYTEEDYAAAEQLLAQRTELDAMVAYLQRLGRYAPAIKE